MTQDGSGRDRPPSLQDVYGEFVELDGSAGRTQTYRIMAELEAEGRRYAVLQSEAMRKEGDIEVFRIAIAGADGRYQLETVEDDDEWERVAELYDDLQFGSDEVP